MNRREFLKYSASTSLFMGSLGLGKVRASIMDPNDFPEWDFKSLFEQIPEKVSIKEILLREVEGNWLLTVKDNSGRLGITQCNDRMQNLVSLLKGLVIPHFEGQDLRNLPQLVDNAYIMNSNYKYTGMPLWNCIGSVEIACWDLIGKIANKPVAHLLGKPIRNEYSIYISDFRRTGDVNEIAASLQEKILATGAKGVKIKVGGRMQNLPENTEQTRKLVPQVRKILGDDVTIYADANGSFSAKEGIETGKLLEDYSVSIFEEPCNFEDEASTLAVANSLNKLKLAGGEQDTSLYKFKRLAESGTYDVLQPDVYYNGGILKTLQVSKIAQKSNRLFAPHSPKADPLIGPFWQVISLVENLYGLQEGVYNPKVVSPSWYQPSIDIKKGKLSISQEIGLGIVYDEAFILKGTKI